MFSITEIMAIRGHRCAAVAFTMDYGNDVITDALEVIRLDSQFVNLQLLVAFDLDDRDAAIAELDRMHAEIND